MNLKVLIMGTVVLLCCTTLFLMNDSEDSDASVVASGTCGTNLNWEYDDATHVLKISGTGTTMVNFTTTTQPWGAYISDIQEVMFNTPNLTTIGKYAFYHCTEVRYVSLPETLSTISSNAFEGCTQLKSVDFPDSLKELGSSSFHTCGLTHIELPVGLKYISALAFAGCADLTTVTVNVKSISSIDTSLWSNCDSLEEAIIGESAEKIFTFSGVPSLKTLRLNAINCADMESGARYFYNTNISQIIIGNMVTHVPDYLAVNIKETLRSVVVGENVQTVGENSFSGCNRLKEVLNFSDLDIVAGADTYGKIAYYADTVSDHVDSTAMVQQKEFIDHHVVTKDDATSTILRVLPVLIAVAVLMSVFGMMYVRTREL